MSINNVALEYRTLNLNYNDRYLLAYQNLLNGLNIENSTVGIDRNYFVDGNAIYVYQLQSYESRSLFFPRDGVLKLEMSFSEPLETACTAVILAQTQNILKIDHYKQVEVENQGVLQ